MSAVTFDTHSFVKRLKADGLTEQQAETLVIVFSFLISPKYRAIKNKISTITLKNTALHRFLSSLKKTDKKRKCYNSMVQNVREIDKDSFATKYDIKEVEHKMDKMEHRITNKTGGMLIALAAFLTAIKFLG